MTSPSAALRWIRSPSQWLGVVVDPLLLLIPTLLWAAGLNARPSVMDLRCGNQPASCRTAEVNDFDRLAVGREDPRSNELSFVTQNSSGIIAAIVPALWLGSRVALGHLAPSVALASWGLDLLVLAQSSAWNGVVMETTRLLVQRPRPFVFQDPVAHGSNPAHYTSFYSGHTSFAALAATSWTLSLASHGASLVWVASAAVLGASLTVATGYFRVAAGRHYPTDTLAGAVAGIAVALLIARIHRARPRPKG